MPKWFMPAAALCGVMFAISPFVIANADTVMSRRSADLAAEIYPGVPVRADLGEHETLLSIDKARRVLGYEPQFSWRTEGPA